MEVKVVAIGVRDHEMNLYQKIGKSFDLEYECYGKSQDIYDSRIYKGKNVVISGNSTTIISDDYFSILEKHDIHYFIAKMTGTDHIDFEAAKRHNVHVANIQFYSPNAISELALAMALSLNRNLYTIQKKAQNLDFTVDFPYFKEIRDCTVGVLGVGHIGSTTAKLFSSLGAKVIGYDPYPYEDNKQFLTYTDLESLKKESDIIIIHVPYIKKVNEHMVNEKFIHSMKDKAILINVARGELVDLKAVVDAVKSGKLLGFGADVLEGEDEINGKKVSKIKNRTIREAISLYPKIIVTPHLGAHTVRAREAQVEIAFKEAIDFINTGSCQYFII